MEWLEEDPADIGRDLQLGSLRAHIGPWRLPRWPSLWRDARARSEQTCFPSVLLLGHIAAAAVFADPQGEVLSLLRNLLTRAAEPDEWAHGW